MNGKSRRDGNSDRRCDLSVIIAAGTSKIERPRLITIGSKLLMPSTTATKVIENISTAIVAGRNFFIFSDALGDLIGAHQVDLDATFLVGNFEVNVGVDPGHTSVIHKKAK